MTSILFLTKNIVFGIIGRVTKAIAKPSCDYTAKIVSKHVEARADHHDFAIVALSQQLADIKKNQEETIKRLDTICTTLSYHDKKNSDIQKTVLSVKNSVNSQDLSINLPGFLTEVARTFTEKVDTTVKKYSNMLHDENVQLYSVVSKMR